MKTETFQDPSALMKRALFQALAIGAVAVTLYMFCVEPCQTSLDKTKKERAALQAQQTQMARDLKDADQVKSRLDALQEKRQVYLKGLLEPFHGYYHPSASALLDPLAADVGLLKIGDYEDLLTRRLPLPQPLAPQLYARKPIRMTCTGSYATIVSFLLRVEEKIPLASLEAFSLKTQKDPDNQTATIVLEWPIKGENTAAAVAKGGVKK